ncbi:SPOR domain-containing protein [Rhodosalinus sp. 5P4]|uniref:SPOR domain-containing protein n=1 Tax=Rhodosalinus sp. 5P4 TaxID=3239196 RepID=UPI0035238371
MIIIPADHARRGRRAGAGFALVLAFALAGCGEDGAPGFLQPQANGTSAAPGASEQRSVKLVERDVEAPEVFGVAEAGLWDGRPSLGGVWVAHPEVAEPERVIIRNTVNGRDVVGALFRRERQNPGPRLQVSSDAAAALGMLAGQPVRLEVVALRRETVQEETGEAPPQEGGGDAESLAAPAEIEAAPLDPVATASAALDEDTAPARAAAEAAPAAADAAEPAPARSYVQIGIFSMEENAREAASAMREEGLSPEIRRQTSQDKTFWRVLVGPAASEREREETLGIVKAAGFADAYVVRN